MQVLHVLPLLRCLVVLQALSQKIEYDTHKE